VIREKRWSLLNWLHWMQPEERPWVWWDGRVETDSQARISVIVEGWPYPRGALDWLIRAAGALGVDEEPDGRQ